MQQRQRSLVLLRQGQRVGKSFQRATREVRGKDDVLEHRDIAAGLRYLRPQRQHRALRFPENLFGSRAEHKFLQAVPAMASQHNQVDGMPVNHIVQDVPEFATLENALLQDVSPRLRSQKFVQF